MESIVDIQNGHYIGLKQVAPPMLPHGNDPKAVRSKLRRRSIPKQLTNIPSFPAPPQPGKKQLPASDLPDGFPQELTFRALAAYSLLRTLGTELRLAPFTPNVFLRALHLPFPNRLMGKIHVALIRVLLSNLDMGYHWSDKTPPFDVVKKRSIDGIKWLLRAGDNLRLLDTYTWPIFYDDYCHLSADIIHASLHSTADFAELRNMDVSGLESDGEKMIREANKNESHHTRKAVKQRDKMDILYLHASDNESSDHSVEKADEKEYDEEDDEDDDDDDYVEKSSKSRSKKTAKMKPTKTPSSQSRKYTSSQQSPWLNSNLSQTPHNYGSQSNSSTAWYPPLQQNPNSYAHSHMTHGKARSISIEPVVLKKMKFSQTFVEGVLGESPESEVHGVSADVRLVSDTGKEAAFGLIPGSVDTFPNRKKAEFPSRISSSSGETIETTCPPKVSSVADDHDFVKRAVGVSFELVTKPLENGELNVATRDLVCDTAATLRKDTSALIASYIKGKKKASLEVSIAAVVDASVETDNDKVTFDAFPDTRDQWPQFKPISKMRSGVPYHRLSLEMKLVVLEFLIDELLESPVFSEIFSQRNFRGNAYISPYGSLPTRKQLENLENDDECAICKMEGDLICCDGCESSFHRACLDLPEEDSLEGSWHCPECLLKDPSNFGPLRAGKKSALDWFTLDDISLSHNNAGSSLPLATSTTMIASEARAKMDVSKAEEPNDFEFLVVHGFVFRRMRNNYDENSIVPLGSSSLKEVLQSIGPANCSRWPLAQIPFDSTLFGVPGYYSLSPSYFQNDDGRFNPNFYANKYRKAPLPPWIRHFDEAMLCEYEIKCGTATTSMLSSVLSSEMTNDKIISSSLRSSTVLFDPYKMISAFLAKIETELLKASLLDEFWRTRETVGENLSWSYEVRTCLSVTRICKLLLELVDLTHPRAFVESWFHIPALKGKPIDSTKSKGVSLPPETEFNPNLECSRWKWERCLPENFLVLIAKEGKSLEEFLHAIRPDLVATSFRSNKRKKVYNKSMDSHNTDGQQKFDDSAPVNEDKQDTMGSESVHIANSDLATSGRKRSSRRSDRFDNFLDDGNEKITRSDKGGVEDFIYAEKRRRVSELESNSRGPHEAAWPLAGRRLFDPIGSISKIDCRRLGRNAGCVAAPFIAYVPSHEVGQVSYHHMWRKRVAKCVSFEELLLCLRILELFLDQSALKRCATLTQRSKGAKPSNSIEVVCTRKDIQTGLEHNLVGKFGSKFAHWHSCISVDLAPLIHDRCKRRKDWVKATSEKIRQQEVIRIREEIRSRDAKRHAEELKRREEARKREDARKDDSRKKEDARKEEIRLKREAVKVRELEIKQRREATMKLVQGIGERNGIAVPNFAAQNSARKRSRKSFDTSENAAKKSRSVPLSESTTECTQVVARHISLIQALIKKFGVTAIPNEELDSLRSKNEMQLISILEREGLSSTKSQVNEVLAKAESDAMRLEAQRECGGNTLNHMFSSMEALNSILMSIPSVLPLPASNSAQSSEPDAANNSSSLLGSSPSDNVNLGVRMAHAQPNDPSASNDARTFANNSNNGKTKSNARKGQNVGTPKAMSRSPKQKASKTSQDDGNHASETNNSDNRLFAQATSAALDQIRINMEKVGTKTPITASNLALLKPIESKMSNVDNTKVEDHRNSIAASREPASSLNPLLLDVGDKRDNGNQIGLTNSAFAHAFISRENAQQNSPKRSTTFTEQVRNLHKSEIKRMIEQWGTNISQEELTRIRKTSENELKAAIQLDGGNPRSNESLSKMLTEFETEVINEFTASSLGSDNGRSDVSMINSNDTDHSIGFALPVSSQLQEKRTDLPDTQFQFQSNGLAFGDMHGQDSASHRFQTAGGSFQQNTHGRAEVSTLSNQGSFLSANQTWLPTDSLSGLMQNQIGSLLSPYAENTYNQHRPMTSWQDPSAGLNTPQYFAGNIQTGSNWGYDPRSASAVDFQLSGYNFPVAQSGFSSQQPAPTSSYVNHVPQAYDANVNGGLHDLLDVFQRDTYDSNTLQQHHFNNYGSSGYSQGRQHDQRNP